MLHTIAVNDWQNKIESATQDDAVKALESGHVLCLPQLPFLLEESEQLFLSENFANPKTKNISYDAKHKILRGAVCSQEDALGLSAMLQRYSDYSLNLMNILLPHYQSDLQLARTSYRPVEIASRKALSYRKDDTRLHVDAFPANPIQGKRILRVFTNINPNNESRVWRLGAPFPKVVDYFFAQFTKPLPGSAALLQKFKITKTRRTLYDHYMLQLHNAMKKDLDYQVQVPQKTHHFPSGSTWIVYTDQVSHAAMSGQFVLEQTFYLPSLALVEKHTSPESVLEKKLGINRLTKR